MHAVPVDARSLISPLPWGHDVYWLKHSTRAFHDDPSLPECALLQTYIMRPDAVGVICWSSSLGPNVQPSSCVLCTSLAHLNISPKELTPVGTEPTTFGFGIRRATITPRSRSPADPELCSREHTQLI